MAKLSSSFKNMVLSLGLITIFSAAIVGGVYSITLEPIQKAAQKKQEGAIKEVTPEFNNSPVDERFYVVSSEGDSLECFPAKKDGNLVGVAVKTFSDKGFSGRVDIMVGFRPDGVIYDYSVLKMAETPGLGAKMVSWFKDSMKGFDPAKKKLIVSKDGGDVDAITAATISSRAFLDAVQRAYTSYFVNNKNLNAAPAAVSDSVAAGLQNKGEELSK